MFQQNPHFLDSTFISIFISDYNNCQQRPNKAFNAKESEWKALCLVELLHEFRRHHTGTSIDRDLHPAYLLVNVLHKLKTKKNNNETG